LFTVLRRSPKLLPFWALSKLYLTFGLQVQASRLTVFLPSHLYDVRTVDGIRFGVRLSKPEDYEVVYGSHEKAFLDIKPGQGDFVLDLGAHIGSYTLRYSRLVGENGSVIAFEPSPENRRILRWNLRLNNAQNVEVRGEALGDFTGTASLSLSPSSTGHSLHHLPDNIHQGGRILVPTIKLDDIQLDRVDFVKMDVEGNEMNVLRGGERTFLSRKPKMQIEVHAPHGQECSVCNWLQDKGFSTKVLGRAGTGDMIESHHG